MPRIPKHKKLNNTRLANSYGGWLYCEGCNKTIGYICYVTYDVIMFEYKCKCGNHGSVNIGFVDDTTTKAAQPLITIRNRLCCPADQSPLLTILHKNLKEYRCEIVCKDCNKKYLEEQTL